MSKFFSVRSDVQFLAVGLAIAALALCLRLYRIDSQELWYDEAISFHMATDAQWLKSARLGSHPPVYYLLLRGWVPLAGSSPSALRLPSAIFGVLSVVLLIGFGSEILNREVGLWAGGFAAISPIHIYYSQEARSYSLLILVLLLTFWALWKAMQRSTWQRWTLVLLCTLFAFYIHFFSVLALFPTLFLLAFWPERCGIRRRCLSYAAAAVICLLLVAPWVLWAALWSPHHVANIDHAVEIWRQTPPALAIPKSIELLTLGFHSGLLPVFFKGVVFLQWPLGLRVLGLTMVAVLAVILVSPWGEKPLSIPWLSKRKAWIAALALFPLTFLWLVSFYKPVYVVGRYDIIVFPGFALLVGLGFAKLRNIPRIGALAVFVVALAWVFVIGNKLWRYYHSATSRYGVTTAGMLHAYVGDADLVIFTGGSAGLTVFYYLHQLGYRDRYCSDKAKSRHFVCRMFPRGHHEFRFLRADDEWSPYGQRPVESTEDAAREYLKSASPEANVWVVLWSTGGVKGGGRVTRQGHLIIAYDEAQLMGALERRGFARRFLPSAPWIVLFQRSDSR